MYRYTGGGLKAPWGVAVDGADNVLVANFAGGSLSHFCVARPQLCPAGLRTGDPISPPAGYTSDALIRLRSVRIDASGNARATDNWKDVPVQTNPGGLALAQPVGVAAPVRTPLLGPPQQPRGRRGLSGPRRRRASACG